MRSGQDRLCAGSNKCLKRDSAYWTRSRPVMEGGIGCIWWCLFGAIIPRFLGEHYLRTLITTGLLTFGLALSLNAQGRGSSSAGGGPPSNPNAEMSSGVGKYSNWDQLAAHQRGSLYFAGKVAMTA